MSSEWDVFISHASEDKDDVARPLADRLRRLGLKVWFDETELKLGDSLSRSIDRGLSHSNNGIVILSPAFFAKSWPEYELRGLTAKAIGANPKILPIWHKVQREDVLAYSPPLADVLGENTRRPLDEVALKIVEAIRPDLHEAIARKIAFHMAKSTAKVAVIPAAELKKSPIRHATFPSEIENRILLIKHALADVHRLSSKEWMEGFQRDAHPTTEIELWEFIAAKYSEVSSVADLTDDEKRNLLSALLRATSGDRKAFDDMDQWPAAKQDAVYEALRPHPEYFEHEETAESGSPGPLFGDLDAFFGDEAKIDDEYLETLARTISRKPG